MASQAVAFDFVDLLQIGDDADKDRDSGLHSIQDEESIDCMNSVFDSILRSFQYKNSYANQILTAKRADIINSPKFKKNLKSIFVTYCSWERKAISSKYAAQYISFSEWQCWHFIVLN